MAGDSLELGDYVRDAREAKRMTQRELAARVGVSRPTITQLERGNIVSPRIAVLQAIAEALDIPPAVLLKLAGATLPDTEPGQVVWLAEQLDKPNLRRLIAIGHALLQEQQGQPRTAGR